MQDRYCNDDGEDYDDGDDDEGLYDLQLQVAIIQALSLTHAWTEHTRPGRIPSSTNNFVYDL